MIEPAALHTELRLLFNNPDPAIATPAAIEATLLGICERLCPIQAANWIFYDSRLTAGIDYFDDSYFPYDRAVVVRATAAKLSVTEEYADNQLVAKESAIRAYFSDLATTHQRIKGKALLFQFYQAHVRLRLPALESFRNLMNREVKLNGIHSDIREIVENRILQS